MTTTPLSFSRGRTQIDHREGVKFAQGHLCRQDMNAGQRRTVNSESKHYLRNFKNQVLTVNVLNYLNLQNPLEMNPWRAHR